MRRLLLRVCILLGVAALPVMFSALIDPARLLGARTDETDIARLLVAGRNVTNVTNYDDRAIELSRAHLLARPPDVLALGSSRIQTLAAPESGSFVNAGLQGATLADIVRVYSAYDAPGRRPRVALLGVDPWTIAARVDDAGEHGSRATRWLATMTRVASPEYFRLALFSLRHHGWHGLRYVVIDTPATGAKTRLANGTMVWPLTSLASADDAARGYMKDELARDARYPLADDATVARREGALERLLQRMRARGVDVTLVLAPYNPKVYSAMRALPGDPLAATERRYREVAARTGTAIVGSYDPALAGVTAADFFDESHLRPAALGRVVRGR